jgi:hypothetical protein
VLGDSTFEGDRSSLGIVYGLTAATRRVATHGPQPYQERTPSDRDSVIFSPQASSSAGEEGWISSLGVLLADCTVRN